MYPRDKITKDLIKQLYIDENKSSKEVAKILECSYSTVLYYVKKYGFQTKPNRARPTYKVSEATKSKISQAAKERYKDKSKHPWTGRSHSIESRQKMSKSSIGINKRAHLPEWDGSKTPKQTAFINSAIWKKTREEVFQRDNYTCQLTGIRGGDLECHHIIPKSKLDYDKWLDKNNLITLSKEAHRLTKNREHLFENIFNKNIKDRGFTS